MDDKVELHENSSHAFYSPTLSPSFPQSSSPISIPSRPSRSASPFPPYKSKMSIRGTPSPPPIESSSTEYNNSQKQQSTPGIMFSNGDFSPPETKRSNSSFYQKLRIRVEQPVGSMSISPSSRDVVLAAYVFFDNHSIYFI